MRDSNFSIKIPAGKLSKIPPPGTQSDLGLEIFNKHFGILMRGTTDHTSRNAHLDPRLFKNKDNVTSLVMYP